MKRRKREREADEREVLGQRRKRESSSSNFEAGISKRTAKTNLVVVLAPCSDLLPFRYSNTATDTLRIFLVNTFIQHSSRTLSPLRMSRKLAPEANRILFVKNLNYNVTAEQLFDLFGKFGPIRQIRQGIANTSKGTAFVVYEDVHDAKQACDKLNGFNFQNRYLVVLYHQPEKMVRTKEDITERQENLERLKQQHGIE
ncbi:hypothetical protein ACN38_g620 [Penicillium nordicum]|uniref:RRM domain-containing protein n=1 Tax=Penicillium nordicum TaxID=229535 RepID=A0A0M9WKJ8_9EURO|nr:hypothetical protein ACN38_g620 [Penicillium nordicum]